MLLGAAVKVSSRRFLVSAVLAGGLVGAVASWCPLFLLAARSGCSVKMSCLVFAVLAGDLVGATVKVFLQINLVGVYASCGIGWGCSEDAFTSLLGIRCPCW